MAGPRQLNIDAKGRVWVVTATGHLVSLDPSTNRLTRHELPDGFLADASGIGPDDDFIGYTASDPAVNKVGMLFAKGNGVYVAPALEYNVPRSYPTTVITTTEQTPTMNDDVAPQPKVVPVETTRKGDGTFVEARIAESRCASCSYGMCSTPSHAPLGVTANRGKAQGTFFYTVALADGTSAANHVLVRQGEDPHAVLPTASDDDFLVKGTVHVTLNSNGILTADVEHVHATECP